MLCTNVGTSVGMHDGYYSIEPGICPSVLRYPTPHSAHSPAEPSADRRQLEHLCSEQLQKRERNEEVRAEPHVTWDPPLPKREHALVANLLFLWFSAKFWAS